MSSTAPAPTGLARAIQASDEENHVFQHLWAPRVISTELPPHEDTIEINDGISQWIPRHLLFRNNIFREIDYRLALQDKPRAIAQPFFTCVPVNPESPEYLWGAVGIPVLLRENERMSIDFERAFDPATEPPVIQMIIRTDTDNVITVDAEQGSSYVTVVDVHRAVIHWMKGTRTTSGINYLTKRFSRWMKMVDEDGAEVEVEIWVWRGLRSLSTDMVNWHLHLCEVESQWKA